MRIYERLSRVYDLSWNRFTEQYPNFILQLLSEYGIVKANILDIGCGTGFLATTLARQGHIVHGIDISPEMISLAIAKVKAAGIANASFVVQNMTRFNVQDEFQLVTCTFDAINYLITPDEVKAMFTCVRKCLGKSGLFVFDSNTEQHYLSVGKGSQRIELGGESFVQEWDYDSINKCAETTFKFFDGTIESHRQRPYGLSELAPIITSSGLRIVKALSWFNNSPYNNESKRLICIAQRNC